MRNEVGFMDAKDQRQRDFLRSVQSLPPLSSVFLCVCLEQRLFPVTLLALK